jgi:hypothetical protein
MSLNQSFPEHLIGNHLGLRLKIQITADSNCRPGERPPGDACRGPVRQEQWPDLLPQLLVYLCQRATEYRHHSNFLPISSASSLVQVGLSPFYFPGAPP